MQIETQELQNLRNSRSKSIGVAKGKGEDVSALMAEVAGIADKLQKSNEEQLAAVQANLARIGLDLPNSLPTLPMPVTVQG